MRIRSAGVTAGALAVVVASCADLPLTSPAVTVATGAPSMSVAASSPVRITELHYDNGGTDVGEAIEITGPANMSLAGWKLVLYNGSGGAAYHTTALTALDAACGDRGVLVINYPVNGIQNGSPDGMALVDAAGTVIEFLSYEGVFAATDGPAVGVTSTDIGVSQGGSGAAGQSLKRLTRDRWQSESPHDFGACNYAEAIGEAVTLAIEPAEVAIGVGQSRALAVTARDADGYAVPATVGWSTSEAGVATVNAQGVVTGVAVGTATITATAGELTATAAVTVERVTTVPPGTVWISELHYDNAGTDVNEAVEIEGPAGTSLDGWRIYLYNGSNSQVYTPTPTLGGSIPSQCNGRGTMHVAISGIQNGDPDAVALVDATGKVVDFISYGGVVVPVNGPAVGFKSVDIGVKESGTTGATESLQRQGTSWFGPMPSTFGQCNGDAPPPPPDVRVTVFGRAAGDPDLPVGFEYQLFADYYVGTARTPTTITWRSMNTSVATVDARGVVRAIAAGSARVEAVAADGTVGSFTVRTQVGTASTTANYLNAVEFGIPTDGDANDDLIITRPQFTSSYNPRLNTPKWVSWTLDASQFGTLDRCNCFTMDPQLPPAVRQISTADYTGAGAVAGFGIDRGHLARSFDRTGAILDNAATFLFTNIIPQAADNNQGPWAALENALGARARTGNEVVYNIAGVAGSAGTVKNEGIITIPRYVWKVAVIMPRGAGLTDVTSESDLEVIAVVMPNVAGIRNVPWETYKVTVDSVEALSGYDLLHGLRNDVEIAVESNTSRPVAAAGGPYSAIRNEPITFSAAASHDADGDALTYAWHFGSGGTATGVTATYAFPQAGSFPVRVIVTDVRGLADTATTTAQVLSYAGALRQAITLVNGLLSSGSINQGAGRDLLAKLETAVKSVDTDRATTLLHVQQTITQLESYVRVELVHASAAAPLQTLLTRIAGALGG